MNWLLEKTVDVKNVFWEFLYQLAESVYEALVFIMKEMITLIRVFPLVRETNEIYEIWLFMVYLSTTCITLIFIYIATKNLISSTSGSSSGNIIRSIEIKQVFSRMLYMIVFIIGSLPFLDLLITFNNTLVNALAVKFDVMAAVDHIASDSFAGNIVAAALIIYQMYLSLKIIIGYWLRVAEINLMAVVSPVMMVLWINPNWGGYLSEWIRRSSSLIFTQFIQVLILALYSKLVHRFFISGSISSLCLAAAFLILMTNVPSLLQRFIAPDSSGAIMAKTYRSITNKPKQYNSIKSNIKSKFNKIIKKK